MAGVLTCVKSTGEVWGVMGSSVGKSTWGLIIGATGTDMSSVGGTSLGDTLMPDLQLIKVICPVASKVLNITFPTGYNTLMATHGGNPVK